jgi:thioredoxin 1
MKVDEFEARIKTAERSVLVEFWAPWCLPCRAISPVLTRMQQKYTGQVDLLKINADESAALLQKLGVLGIPTLIGYRQGEVLFRKTGAQPVDVIEHLFAALAGDEPLPRSPGSLDRLIRGGIGLVLITAGISVGWSYWLIGLGGLVAFTAVYDRCPIYRALAPRIKNLIKSLIAPQKNSA